MFNTIFIKLLDKDAPLLPTTKSLWRVMAPSLGWRLKDCRDCVDYLRGVDYLLVEMTSDAIQWFETNGEEVQHNDLTLAGIIVELWNIDEGPDYLHRDAYDYVKTTRHALASIGRFEDAKRLEVVQAELKEKYPDLGES